MEFLNAQAPFMDAAYPVSLLLQLLAALLLLTKDRSWSTYLMSGAVVVAVASFGLTMFPEAFESFLTIDPTDTNVPFFVAYSVVPSYANVLFSIGLVGYVASVQKS